MALTLLNVSFVAVWFGLSLFCAIALEALEGRYILQETGRSAVWAIVAGVAWFLLSLLIPGFTTRLRSPTGIGAFVLWTALTGWYAGLLAIRVVNCVGDLSPSQQATIAKIDPNAIRRMTVLTISAPSPGVMFDCPNEVWALAEATHKQFFVHMGRLGLLWGELR